MQTLGAETLSTSPWGHGQGMTGCAPGSLHLLSLLWTPDTGVCCWGRLCRQGHEGSPSLRPAKLSNSGFHRHSAGTTLVEGRQRQRHHRGPKGMLRAPEAGSPGQSKAPWGFCPQGPPEGEALPSPPRSPRRDLQDAHGCRVFTALRPQRNLSVLHRAGYFRAHRTAVTLDRDGMSRFHSWPSSQAPRPWREVSGQGEHTG